MRTENLIKIDITATKKNLVKARKNLEEVPDSLSRQQEVCVFEEQLVGYELELKQLKDQRVLDRRAATAERRQQQAQEQNELKKIKAQEKQQRMEAEVEASEAYNAMVASTIQEKIEEYDVVQVVEQECYYIKLDGELHHRNMTMLDREIFRFENKQHINTFHSLLEQMGRNYLRDTYSFTENNPRVLNLAEGVRERWLKPVKTDNYQCPESLDLLLRSVSGGNQEIRLHIEECIIRKYRQPGDYKIPSLLLFGEGGVGKNELVEDVLAPIFVDSTTVTNFKVLTENAAELMGKAIVLVDETISSKSDYDKFKSIAGNKTFSMKALYQNIRVVPNIMWLIITGQDQTGPLAISNDGTTRRISPIHYTRHLFHWLADLRGEVYDKSMEANYKKIWDQMKKRDFTGENFTQWLGYLEAKFPDDLPVKAYHGEAFQDMVDAHKTPLESLIDEVVLANYKDKPTSFGMDDLFALYREYSSRLFVGRQPLGRNKMIQNIKGMAMSNRIPGWKYNERQTWEHQNNKGESRMLVPVSVTGRVQKDFDIDLYLETDSNGRVVNLKNWRVDADTTKPKMFKLGKLNS